MSAKLQKIVTGRAYICVRSITGGAGSGAGKGGGGGGSIREAGGAFGAMEAAREGQYFYNKEKEQLLELKKHLSGEIEFHEDQIRRHMEAVQRAKSKVRDLKEAATPRKE